MDTNLSDSKTSTPEIPKVDETLINSMLNALINGASCSNIMPLFTTGSGEIWAKSGDSIDASKAKGKIRFAGRILQGGIWDNEKKVYMCPSKHFSYILEGSILTVNALCEKQSFYIVNFDKNRADFGIKLASNPLKEVAIVINLADSMREYLFALKEIAPYLASHLLKDNGENYAKISLVGFSYYTASDFGTFTKERDFVDAISKLEIRNVPTQMINYALILAMSNFTKDNGLAKELYLITDGNPVNMKNQADMLYLTQNLNRNIVKNSGGSKENAVKINCFGLGGDYEYLKDLATQTEGKYFEPKNILELKRDILVLSNDGKMVDPKEFGNVIIPAKTHKMYDPDDPDNPPL